MDHAVFTIQKLDALGITMTLGGQKLVGGFVEVPLKGIDLQLQRCALIDIAAAVDVHIALCLHGVIRQAVFHTVRTDDGVAPAQFGAPFQHHIDVGLPGNLLRTDV